jgi:hypothetical protein
VFKAKEQPYLYSLVEPLELTLVTPVSRETANELGLAMQGQFETLKAKGFDPVRTYVDPQSGLVALQGKFTGVEIDVGGAGDHLDKVDIRIRRIKETIRCAHAGLEWKLPKSMVKDLVKFANGRNNMKSTSARVDKVAPRIAFSGRKPNYRKEYGLRFGNYCECYDPKVVSKDALRDRTEPCIALYPACNAAGSWVFLNMKTNKRVRRSTWEKMVTTDLVIARMNALAEEEGEENVPLFVDEILEVLEQEYAADEERHMVDAGGAEDADADGDVEEQNEEPEGQIAVGDEIDISAEETEDMPDDIPIAAIIENRRARMVAGVRRHQVNHISLKKGLRDRGEPAFEAVIAELKQLLKDKRALTPLHRKDLSRRQLKKMIRSCMFLKEKFNAKGEFVKIKARLVADGRMQDRALYPDLSSPTGC